MTETEIERLAELISIKTSEKYLVIAEKLMKGKIQLHYSECEVKRFTPVKIGILAILTSAATLLGKWFLSKL